MNTLIENLCNSNFGVVFYNRNHVFEQKNEK